LKEVTLFLKFAKLELLTIMLVSPANKTGLDSLFNTLGKSLMEKRKSNGPSIDP
jgi:hypothetical protein